MSSLQQKQKQPWNYSKWQIAKMYMCYAARIIIIVSSICFGLHIIGINILKYLPKNQILLSIIFFIIVFSIIYTGGRDFYLPFLGLSVYPCGSLAQKIPSNADKSITVQVPPNVNVIYWASEPSNPEMQPISNPWDAYANYDNSGVVRSDANGMAILHVRSPSSYKVGLFNTTLKLHIHYRICQHPGMLSEIKTVYL